MIDTNRIYDVLVIGGGNAALCAAITARRAGATVLLLEHAPKALRGGNSRHTRNLRYTHKQANEFLTGPYDEEEFWQDLSRVTAGKTDESLARYMIRESEDLLDWASENGVRFQPPLSGTLSLARTNAFFLGGGKALMNAYYAAAGQLGVEIEYHAEATDLCVEDTRFTSAMVTQRGDACEVRASAVVVASGGFESNLSWLKQAWGDPAENFLVRGTSYNQGRMLRILLDQGARPVSEPNQCHAVAIDARAPRFDGGIVTRVDCVPFSIVVNKDAQRFYDEGEDIWPKRYAIWGRLVAQQPDQIAYALIDAKSQGLFMPTVFSPVEADSIRELANKLKLDPDALENTVEAFNRSVKSDNFDPSVLDDCATEGLDPPKTHWARALDRPPFFGYPLRPGITFTYLGVAVNEHAQVLMRNDEPSRNIYAAGEIMAGNILGQGYIAGIGMTIGSVFGRLAGQEAAQHARGGTV
jgi:tricarballylate dehydrogenase